MRLPTHLQVSALIRRVQAAGGFATVLARGERDAGTLLVVLCERGAKSTAYERMPLPDGTRKWTPAKVADPDDPRGFSVYLDRRKAQDPDLWMVELDVHDGERFIADLTDC